MGHVADRESIRGLLGLLPKGVSKPKLKEIAELNIGNDQPNMAARVVYADLREMLLDLKDQGFEAAIDALNEEVFGEEAN